ncbi:ImmA/IrrE family metallo-endopeptidase [Paenibacillus sp.]|uniref:ImmA/IrrE family metallo-endopeptidase n=1 Tax=Paenibacillus sp. TaxID=58172 RepID=UPI00281149A2|nr:ImmA/IrrE family metallo-endopeptidase [Paenibacillus sp.]
MPYERLLKDAEEGQVDVYEKNIKGNIKGLYSNNIIWINRNITTAAEKTCILAEELGHHHTTVGDILDQTKVTNRKQERRARSWAYDKLVPLSAIIEAHKAGVKSRHEFAERLQITEEFLAAAIEWYQEKYGLFIRYQGSTIYFEPLVVLELFES